MIPSQSKKYQRPKKHYEQTKGKISCIVFCPRTHSRTFLQCFALHSHCSEAKHCRNVLGRVLGQKTRYKTPS